jgi:hypothetical protein
MTKTMNPRTVFTISFLAGLLVLVGLRNNGWRLPLPSEWASFGLQQVPSKPEDAIYNMLDAARAGDIKGYLQAFSGPLREQLQQVIKESNETKFRNYLTAQNATLQSVAVTVTDRASENEAQARVE